MFLALCMLSTDRKKSILHLIERHSVILNESHTIKNAGNCSSRSIRALRARNRCWLTGTPFGRHIVDIENQLRFIGMQQKDLAKLQLKAVTKQKIFADHRPGTFGKRIAIPLIEVMRRVIMRHKKDQKFNDVPIVSMPEKEEGVIFVDFTKRQRMYYDKLYSTAKERYDYFKTIQSVGRGAIRILAALHPARHGDALLSPQLVTSRAAHEYMLQQRASRCACAARVQAASLLWLSAAA